MTELLVTDIVNDYSLTTFSEDKYPNNKNYELTNGQFTALKSVNILLKNLDEEPETNEKCIISEIDTVINNQKDNAADDYATLNTPSLSSTFDDKKRVDLLEQEVVELRKKKSKSKNLLDFSNLLFHKNTVRVGILNKRAVILNYALLNNSPLTMEDLEVCEDDEINNMYLTIKQYHEIHKKKIIVSNFISILIAIIEHILIKIGFEEIEGLSKEITTELIDLEVGDDCEQLATTLGISNNPVFNIFLFIAKVIIKRLKVL